MVFYTTELAWKIPRSRNLSRPQRVEYENAYYHVMNRGAGRQTIFPNSFYYKLFLITIAEAVSQFDIEIHAYCLMGNHYHLLIKTPRANLSRAMRHINGIYTQRYNRSKKTDGTLFRGRYKAILIDSDSYILHLSKYIHLNPLVAGVVEKLEEYPWSSYLSYVNEIAPVPHWLTRDEIYGQITNSLEKANQYWLFMQNKEINEDVISFYKKERLMPVLGNELFVHRLKLRAPSCEVPRQERVYKKPSITTIIKEVCFVFDVSVDALLYSKKGRGCKNTPRKVAMYLAQKIGDYRLQEIAEAFGIAHYGGVSHAIHSILEMLKKEEGIEEQINDIINRLDP